MEEEFDVENGQVKMAAWHFFQRNEEPSLELSGNALSQLEELDVGIEFFKMAVILLTCSPEIEVRRILGQQQIAALLKQETLRKRHTSKLLFSTGVENAVQSAFNNIESRSKLESDAILEVDRAWLSKSIEAFQGDFKLILCYGSIQGCVDLVDDVIEQEILC